MILSCNDLYKELTKKLPSKLESDFSMIYDIINLSCGLFKYEGLQEVCGLESENFEIALLLNGRLCFYKSVELGKVILGQYIPYDNLNENLLPKKVNVLSLNGKVIGHQVNFEDIILVKDNPLSMPPIIAIDEFIQKLKTIDINVFKILKLKTLPLGCIGNAKQVKTFKEACRQFNDDKNMITIIDKNIADSIKTFDIKINTTLDELYGLKQKYFKECLNALGISFALDKKERLISDEVSEDKDYSNMKYQMRHNYRKNFIEKVNEKYGTNIKFIPLYDLFEEDAKSSDHLEGENDE